MAYDPYARLRAFNEWPDAFSAAELDAIVVQGDALAAGSGAADLAMDGTLAWLPDRLADLANRVNEEFYRFDIAGLAGRPRYELRRTGAEPEMEPVWRRDLAPTAAPVKLCLRLQLSDPDSYEGGGVELRGVGAVAAPRRRGLLIVFPSYYGYRVAQVRSGECRMLSVNLAGPAFR